ERGRGTDMTRNRTGADAPDLRSTSGRPDRRGTPSSVGLPGPVDDVARPGAPSAVPTRPRQPWWRGRDALGYAFVAGPLLFMFVVLLVPIGYNAWISLHDWSLVGNDAPEFIGLGNFV